MLFSRLRLLLIGLFLVLGIVLHVQKGIGVAWYLYVTSLILLATHFLYGNVWAAFSKLRKGQLEEAERLLKQTTNPAWLAPGPKAYYHFIRGMIALQRKALPESENHLQKALDRGLRTNNDNALAALNLAHICFYEKRWKDCAKYLEQSKARQPNDLMIKEKIREMEKVLAQQLK